MGYTRYRIFMILANKKMEKIILFMIFGNDKIYKWAIQIWVFNQQTCEKSKNKRWLIGSLLPQEIRDVVPSPPPLGEGRASWPLPSKPEKQLGWRYFFKAWNTVWQSVFAFFCVSEVWFLQREKAQKTENWLWQGLQPPSITWNRFKALFRCQSYWPWLNS